MVQFTTDWHSLTPQEQSSECAYTARLAQRFAATEQREMTLVCLHLAQAWLELGIEAQRAIGRNACQLGAVQTNDAAQS